MKITRLKEVLSRAVQSDRRRLARDIEILRKSPLLDPVWYRETNADLRDTPIDVARHYLEHGAAEGRDPHPLFDTSFYLNQNTDVATKDINPLVHYILIGAQEKRDPHPLFDTKWYLEQILPSNRSHLNPLEHYLSEGFRQGLSRHPTLRNNINPSGNIDSLLESQNTALLADNCEANYVVILGKETDKNSPILDQPNILYKQVSESFAISRVPLVSIIITNMNGERHLPDLFKSLKDQTYKNFEIIFVDDNSKDGSAELAKQLGADKIIVTKENSGFAKSNNIGLARSEGELIALLNNDTRVDPNWLEALVSEMRRDRDICVVAPKIRFWQQFQCLWFKAHKQFSIDRPILLDSLDYKKFFVRRGAENKTHIEATLVEGFFAIEIDLPIQTLPYNFSFLSQASQALSLQIASFLQTFILSNGSTFIQLDLNESAKRSGCFIINNAGSLERQPLKPEDRGFGELDYGQYDFAVDVDLFCGCAALIRRDALHGRELFISEFIAYYEDSELSKWLRSLGYRIRYCPSSIVYHKHSATNVEKSLFWFKQTFKNAIIFEYIFSDRSARQNIIDNAKSHLNHLSYYYPKMPESSQTELEFAASIPSICTDIDALVSLVDRNEVPRHSAPRIGIYNSFWNTLGGGEAHALDIAEFLCELGQVELISEDDFDLLSICKYFNIELPDARKRLVTTMSTAITGEYDIFINARYQSELVSAAKKSFFIVSFPSKTPSQPFLDSYYFLSNSEYTMSWMERYWSKDRFTGEVLYPAIPPAMLVDFGINTQEKKKLILSVGRFAADGHTKNQLEIALAFRLLCKDYPDAAREWSLALIGSVSDQNYISQVQSMIDGLNAQILPNAKFDVVREMYRDASIYVHGSGYGRSADSSPELFEHFGMAVAQALGSGCLPIVYGAAGPEEIVRKTGVGCVFYTVDDLVRLLAENLGSFDSAMSRKDRVMSLVGRAGMFSKETQRKQLAGLINWRGVDYPLTLP